MYNVNVGIHEQAASSEVKHSKPFYYNLGENTLKGKITVVTAPVNVITMYFQCNYISHRIYQNVSYYNFVVKKSIITTMFLQRNKQLNVK
jgi:hypothetical protein